MRSIMVLDGFDKRYREYKRVGWVYVARNPCFIHVSDRDQAEAHVHQALAASRVNPSKEFFLAPLMTVVRILDQAASH